MNDCRYPPCSCNPTVYKREVPNEEIHLHDRGTLSDGTSVGKRGALWYVLDEDDRAVSKGYHEIVPTGDGRYEGKIGAKYEVFEVEV